MFVRKDENRLNRGQVWPIFKQAWIFLAGMAMWKFQSINWYFFNFYYKMVQSRPLFVYFHSFLITISIQIEQKHRWCAWDSNPRPQDGRRRWNHGAMAATSNWYLNVTGVVITAQYVELSRSVVKGSNISSLAQRLMIHLCTNRCS